MEPKSGLQLGNHHWLVRRLVTAGTAEVWLCEDKHGRLFAAKLLNRDDDLIRLTAFEQFAHRLLQHIPGIVHLHECLSALGRKVLILDLLEGVSLADRIKQEKGPLNLGEAIRYMLDTAVVLKEMHALGVVHRDIKPGNIQVRRREAVVMDLGLSQLVGSAFQQAPGRYAQIGLSQADIPTRWDLVTGTVEYLAPNVFEGDFFLPKDDLYALGCTLHACLTGKPPFGGKTPLEIGSKHVRRAPQPLATTFPVPLRDLHMALLAKSRKDRPSADDTISSLSAIAA
jgi:serine/threonine-protein kinase